jgi:SAM-dependent methyltransferase
MGELGPGEHAARVRAHYLPLLEKFGVTSRAVDYHHSGNHMARFVVLAGIEDIRQASILDVGCGVGHLAKWLKQHGHEGEYTGIDILPEMVARARETHPDMRFEQCDILAEPDRFRADFVMSNGIFHLGDAPLMHRVVAAMYGACGKGAAFNSLSTWDEAGSRRGFFCADPLETLAFCRTLTPHILMRHDYLPHDFTVFLYRE